MSFAKEFIKAAADNTGLAAETLAQKVKNERVDYDDEHGVILSIQQIFKKVVAKELADIAVVDFSGEAIFVDRGIEGTIQTQEAVKQAYEKLVVEETLQTSTLAECLSTGQENPQNAKDPAFALTPMEQLEKEMMEDEGEVSSSNPYKEYLRRQKYVHILG